MNKTQEIIQKILKNGLTRAEIARRMETSWSMINYWDNGTHQASPSSMKKLEKLAGIKNDKN